MGIYIKGMKMPKEGGGVMAEYIEREAAIRIASGYCHPANIAAELAKLPAADVRPVVRGKWTLGHIPSTSGGSYAVVQCSECNSQFPIWRTNFCPNCGADMRSTSMSGAN